jgi:Fic family protein
LFQKATTGVRHGRSRKQRLVCGTAFRRHGISPAKLAKCSPDPALRDIRELLERGILIRNEAGGRSTSYRLAQQTSTEVD